MSLIPATTPRGTDPRESWMQTAVAPLPLWPIQASTGGGQFHLGIDLTEYPDKFIIHADAPGARDEDVDVTITHGILNVKISRQKNVERDLGTFYHREERLFAERRRSIKLPENSDCDHAIAELKHGILTVTLPKVATIVKMKSIPLIRG